MRTIFKSIIAVIVVLFVVTSCQSTDKLIQNKQYDLALDALVKQSSYRKATDKMLHSLSEAYHTANQMDHERIKTLKNNDQPESCIELYDRYTAIEARQNLIKQLPETVLKQINFVPLDLKLQLAESKIKVQRYLFAKAGELQRSGNKSDAKSAYIFLIKLKTMNPVYPEIDKLIRQALILSASTILLAFENDSPIALSQEVVNGILNFTAEELVQSDISFFLNREDNKQYDYLFVIRLNSIKISPERTESRIFTERKDMDGKMLEEAVVNEVTMSKSCEMKAFVDIREPMDNILIFSTPVNAVSNFTYSFSTVKGDKHAISDQTAINVNRRPIPFPADDLLVVDAAKQLNLLTKQVIFIKK
jgi:hypothetical protein